MVLDDRLDDRKADAEAARLGGEEGLEKPAWFHLSEAFAVVLDRKLHAMALRVADADQHAAVEFVVVDGGVESVEQEVQDHLLQLDAVTVHQRSRRRQMQGERNPPDEGVALDQPGDVAHQVVEVEVLELLRFLLAHEAPQVADDVARAAHVLSDVEEDVADLVEVRGLALEQARAGVGVGEDRRQRLVELMRQRHGELAHGRDSRHVGELLLHLPELGVGATALQGVSEDAGDDFQSTDGVVSPVHLSERGR